MKNKLVILFFIFCYACVPIVSTVDVIKTGVGINDDPRSIGTIVDDSVIEKTFKIKVVSIDKKYFLNVSGSSLDGRFLIEGKVETFDEKIKMTKIAWEINGVRSVQNNLTVNDQSSLKNKALDLLITSQLRVAILANKKVKSNNFSISTINQNIYIFGIARDQEEKQIVINEAKQITDVKAVTPSIFLKKDLSNNQRIPD
jgi:osmotically-inducible protein OsmY